MHERKRYVYKQSVNFYKLKKETEA